MTAARIKRLHKGFAKNGDVLFAHNATVGPVVLLRTKEPLVILSTSLTAFRCNTQKIDPAYLRAYMLSIAFVRQYTSVMQQSTRNQVPITAQRKFYFLLPPLALQREFAAFIAQQEKAKASLKESLAALTAAQKSLMNSSFAKE